MAVFVIVIAALYFGRDVFVPLALAGLLSFALAPLIAALRRQGLPRTPAVLTVVISAFVCIFVFGFVVAGQVSELGASLPRYEYNIREKVRSLQSSAPGGGFIERAGEVLRDLRKDIEEAPEADQDPSLLKSEAVEPEPIPVQIRQPDPAPLQLLQTIVGPLIEPLATTGIVIVFVVFMLLQREDLRDRFIRLFGARDLHRTTQALGDAAERVGRYLLMQLVVNVAVGIPIGIGLWLIGVPNPVLWGMLSIVLRFVPFIGPVIAAAFPLVLSIAVDPGWTMLIWTAALFIVLELISGNIVEPWLYGASTGLSSIAILAAAIFWTWLWGPVGLLLSTPLTVCLVVLGRHVQQFGFLNVLLGSEPVLEPSESLYQRLLAGDPDEATERAEEYLKTRSILTYFEEVAIPALSMFEHDRARGVLTDERRALVAAGALTLVDNLSEHEDVSGSDEVLESGEGQAPPGRALPDRIEPVVDWRDRPVLCAGGRGNLDDVAAAILAQLLERQGLGTRIASFQAIATGSYASLDLDSVQVICLSYMNSDSIAHARYAVRRLRRRTSVPIVVGFWSTDPADPKAPDLVAATRSDQSATSLSEAIEEIAKLVP
jgi:predicted PurR-regulated permease PerM